MKFNYINPGTLVAVIIVYCTSSEVPILLLFLKTDSIQKLILLLMLSLNIILFLYTAFGKKVEINSQGVFYSALYNKKKSLNWEEIEDIVIVEYAPAPIAQSSTFICFSSKKYTKGTMLLTFSPDCTYSYNDSTQGAARCTGSCDNGYKSCPGGQRQ